MKPKRPNVVMVFAILNMVFGVISIKVMLVAGLMEILDLLLGGMAHSSSLRPHIRINLALGGVFAVAFVFIVAGQVLLMVSGIGLFTMKGWARKGCIAYSVFIIVYSLVYIMYIVINPSCFNSDVSFAQRPMEAFTLIQPSISSIASAIIGMAYATLLLVAMLRPDVAAAFAKRPRRRRINRGGETDDEGRQESDG